MNSPAASAPSTPRREGTPLRGLTPMRDLSLGQKCIEVKIRTLPNTERADRKDVSRVFLSLDTMLDLKLESGQPCYVWKIDTNAEDEGYGSRKEAIAWPSPQKINRNVMQMFKSFQEHCGFRLEDRILVSSAPPLVTADTVVLRDVSGATPLEVKDRGHWEWFLEDKLSRAESIFSDMTFDVTLKGKRSFIVESFVVEGRPVPNKIVKFASTSRVKIIDEDDEGMEPVSDGPRPTLEIPQLAGLNNSLKRLNDFLKDFSNSTTNSDVDGSWGHRACGVLVHGAPGTGKSLVLNTLADRGWGRVYHIDADAKVANLKDTFKEARLSAPSVVVVDDIEHLLASPDPAKPSPHTKALGDEMDSIAASHAPVLVVASALSPSVIPRQLRKRGRFAEEIGLPVPDAAAREQILTSFAPAGADPHTIALLREYAAKAHAYTPEDLALLFDKACSLARKRIHEDSFSATPLTDDKETFMTPQNFALISTDLNKAMLEVRPSAMHDITLQPPKVHWSDIGGQHALKSALRRAIETPLTHPELLQRLGAVPKKGLLLYGPPGCSKTLSAAAVATEAGFNFFAVKGAELLNMYVGESERAVRNVFARARAAAPAVIFFDEIESIGSKRTNGNVSGGGGVNVLTTLLNEMDGIEALKGVTVLAATNKPEALDLALLRPGRFDELLYVPPPDFDGRKEILSNKRKKMDWAEDVDLDKLAMRTEGYSGAETVAVCQVAVDHVIERALESGDFDAKVTWDDFEFALGKVKRQITPDMVEGYKRWAKGVGNGVVEESNEEITIN